MADSADDPVSTWDWDAYNALPEWEVTASLSRTARFRVHAVSPEDAEARVLSGGNGVRSMGDLYDAGELEINQIISVEPVTAEDGNPK